MPAPLVTLRDDPPRWLRNKIELAVDALVLAHLGVLIAAALYYLTTQTDPVVKHWWDTTVTPAAIRHDIRDVGEGVLASCFSQAIVWNHFTRGHQKAGQILRRLRSRYGVPVVFAAVVLAAAVGTAAFILGEAALHLLSVRSTARAVTGSIWHRTAVALWTSNRQKKLLGFVAALVARRPLHVLFDDSQRYFAARRVEAGKGLRFYHPPVFAARYNASLSQAAPRRYSRIVTYLTGAGILVALGLAAFGYYVLTYRP